MARPMTRSRARATTLSTTRVLRSQTRKESDDAAATLPKIVIKKHRPHADPKSKRGKPNTKPRRRKPPSANYTCRICIEEQPRDEFFKWVPKRSGWEATEIPFKCVSHLARNPRNKKIDPVCKSCIGNAMSAKLDTLGPRQVGAGCLEPGCTQEWGHHFILRYMPPGAPLKKFNMEMLQVWKETVDPRPMTCISPKCNAIGLPDIQAAGYPQVVCNECGVRSCAQCLVPWHKDLNCAEHAAQHVDEKMSEEEKLTLLFMQAKDAKRCPNCQMVIEKDGGCDSMICEGCYNFFNWNSAVSAVLGVKKPQAHYIRDDAVRKLVSDVGCEADERTEPHNQFNFSA